MARDPKKPSPDKANGENHEVSPDADAEREDAVETSRYGNAVAGAILDGGRSKAKQSETERELRETTGDDAPSGG